jgi:C4-dicarboxylate-specific signal transduction histidine kinase
MVHAEDPNEANGTFGRRSSEDARIIERMSRLAAILKNENATGEEMMEGDEDAEKENCNRKLAELNMRLGSFEEGKSSPTSLHKSHWNT